MAKEQAAAKPAARKAQQKIRDDVRRGKLKKPSKCSRCGKATPRKNLQGHHTNGYKGKGKKTATFLCPKCHMAANKKTPGQGVNRFMKG